MTKESKIEQKYEEAQKGVSFSEEEKEAVHHLFFGEFLVQ